LCNACIAGAVAYGAAPRLISERRAKVWYGLRSNQFYNSNLHDGLPYEWSHECGAAMVKNIFMEVIARASLVKDEFVDCGAYCPVSDAQEVVKLPLFCTDQPCPRRTSVRLTSDPGMQQIAEMVVDLSMLRREGVPLREREFQVKLQVGLTELVVAARVRKTGRMLPATVVA
jgi:hypothetical protein